MDREPKDHQVDHYRRNRNILRLVSVTLMAAGLIVSFRNDGEPTATTPTPTLEPTPYHPATLTPTTRVLNIAFPALS